MNPKSVNYYGVVAITGSSSVLGGEIARQIAPHSKAVILVGRVKDRLQKLMTEISAANPKIKVHPILCDLAEPTHRKRLIQDLSTLKIDTFILNSEMSTAKDLLTTSYPEHLKAIELNVTSNIDLMYHLYSTLDPVARIQVISEPVSPANSFLALWGKNLVTELQGSTHKVSVMIGAVTDTEKSARKCIDSLEQSGVHYLSLRDRFVWSLSQFLGTQTSRRAIPAPIILSKPAAPGKGQFIRKELN